MEMLLASLLALAVGPLIVSRLKDIRSATVAIDAFVIVAIGGLIIIHILPEALTQGGWWVLLTLFLGLFGPLLAERGLHQGANSSAGRIVIFLALAGLAAHAVIDGLALGHEHTHGHGHSHGPLDHSDESTGLLSLAVILHRLPVGIGIWWLIPRTLGVGVAMLTLGLIAVATVVGFFVGDGLDIQGGSGLAIFEGLLAGSLLHVVFHSHLPSAPRKRSWEPASAVGTIAALGILIGVTSTHPSPIVSQAADTFMRFALQSAPALLLAYLVVGFIHVFVPAQLLTGVRGGPFGQAVRGVVAGLPVPVCSCGIVPVYRELILKGTPAAAAMAFLVATPELEIAAFLLSVQLMGMPLAVARLLAAGGLALVVGWLVGRLVSSRTREPVAEGASCCGVEPDNAGGDRTSPPTSRDRIRRALRFGFGEAVDHTAAWILLGLGIAALASPYLRPDWLIGVHPILQVTGAALIGLPLYVCASGSTPLAAMLVATGLSPGAAVALLLTGPATNVTTFGLLSSLHGRRIAIAFGLCMIAGSIALGVGVDAVLDPVVDSDGVAHDHHASWFEQICLAGLALVFAASLLRQGTRPFIERVAVARGESGHDHGHDHHHGDGLAHGH